MKKLETYLVESLFDRFRKNKDDGLPKHRINYSPKTQEELRKIIEKLLEERGKDANLNDIDVSHITDMSGLFKGLDPHDIDISKWNVSNVKDMSYMFYNCSNFVGTGIEYWDVDNVVYMNYMFKGCRKLNANFKYWNPRNIANSEGQFAGARSGGATWINKAQIARRM